MKSRLGRGEESLAACAASDFLCASEAGELAAHLVHEFRLPPRAAAKASAGFTRGYIPSSLRDEDAADQSTHARPRGAPPAHSHAVQSSLACRAGPSALCHSLPWRVHSILARCAGAPCADLATFQTSRATVQLTWTTVRMTWTTRQLTRTARPANRQARQTARTTRRLIGTTRQAARRTRQLICRVAARGSARA